jgi:hypothetical protein
MSAPTTLYLAQPSVTTTAWVVTRVGDPVS